MTSPSIQLLRKKTYIKMIEASAKTPTELFRYTYARVNGEEKNILFGDIGKKDGLKSCAFFLSSILYLNKLCYDVHAGVDGLEKDLLAFGWYSIASPRPGAVVIWESQGGRRSDETSGRHAGFVVSDTEAISNDSNESGMPHRHHITYGTKEDGTPERKIETIYWHRFLDQETW